MREYLSSLTKLLEQHQDKEKAKIMSVYMRNNFPFLGIQSPLRKKIEKERFKELVIEKRDHLERLTNLLRNMKEREYHYIAISLLEKYKKIWIKENIVYFESLVISNARRDSVDSIDTTIIWKYFFFYPEQKNIYSLKRSKAPNIWLRRTAIQFQLLYKKDTDTILLAQILKNNLNSQEFFIQKAMWRILREYSKTDKEQVKEFITQYSLPKLTITEGSKYL